MFLFLFLFSSNDLCWWKAVSQSSAKWWELIFFFCCAVLANALAELHPPRPLRSVRDGCLPARDEQLLVRDYGQPWRGSEIPEGCDWGRWELWLCRGLVDSRRGYRIRSYSRSDADGQALARRLPNPLDGVRVRAPAIRILVLLQAAVDGEYPVV